MGLETLSTVEIRERYHKLGKEVPNMHWQYGTMWIDTDDTDDLRIIKEVMEDEVLNNNMTVDFNLLKATETEPWDQWAMAHLGAWRSERSERSLLRTRKNYPVARSANPATAQSIVARCAAVECRATEVRWSG